MKNLARITESAVANGHNVWRIKPLPELEAFRDKYTTNVTACPKCGNFYYVELVPSGDCDIEVWKKVHRTFWDALSKRGVGATSKEHECE